LRVIEALVAAGYCPTVWHGVAAPNLRHGHHFNDIVLASGIRLPDAFRPGSIMHTLDPFNYYSPAVSPR